MNNSTNKKILIIIILLLFSFQNLYSEKILTKIDKNFFIENQGQWDKQVLYIAKTEGMNVWITKTGVVYDLYEIKQEKQNSTKNELFNNIGRFTNSKGSITRSVVKMGFQDAENLSKNVGLKQLNAYHNYFIGDDPSKWARNVRLFKEVQVKEIYKGIDIKYYFENNFVRFDLIVKPGCNPEKIKLNFQGSEDIQITKNKNLLIHTNLYPIELKKLYAYQNIKNSLDEVECNFNKISSNIVMFELGKYEVNKKLIIDPLVFSTYLGGNDQDMGKSIKVDDKGNVYIAGNTLSLDFPTKNGYQEDKLSSDAIICKLNSNGELLYSTYLGGDEEDSGESVEIDNEGNIYVAGGTFSSNFPTNSLFKKYMGNGDIFVTKFNPLVNDIIYSTYLGGSSVELWGSINVDSRGNAYVTGQTASMDFPLNNQYQAHQGGFDIFCTKINASGTNTVYSTYLGGKGDDESAYQASTIDSNGCVYITGNTLSPDFPIKNQIQKYKGNGDAFAVKLNEKGSDIIYSTYLGGKEAERGYSIKTDKNGNVYIAGRTSSPDFPVRNQFQNHQGEEDIFVTKLDSNGSEILYSTYIGGNKPEIAFSLVLDSIGSVYLAGYTESSNFPIKHHFQDQLKGLWDAFIIKINLKENKLLYSTYLGGSDNDWAFSIDTHNRGNAYVTGSTYSGDFPTKNQIHDVRFERDCFITKYKDPPTEVNEKKHYLKQKIEIIPNPFTNSTTIEYDLANPAHVKIDIYNSLGDKIETLFDEFKLPGGYEAVFDGDGLPAGVYYYKMRIGGDLESGRMVIVK